jgi:glycosyltransferase involved in cell wall biosynthesis
VPYFGNVSVIAFVPDNWEQPWQPRHQILSRLARYFHVVWFSPAPYWRNWLKAGPPMNSHVHYGPPPGPGLTIYRPGNYLPEIGRPRFLARWIRRELLRRAQHVLPARGSQKIILYIWRPDLAWALDLIECDLSCYHIDDEYSFSEIEKPLDEHEARLISRVDRVFIHSHSLLEKKGKLNPRTLFIPNGVDYSAFAASHTEPSDLGSIPHPRIGYVGRIKSDLNYSLLIDLARRHKEWSFVFVGPIAELGDRMGSLQTLAQMPNVYFLGAKPVSALPAYTQHLDVCMLCYEVNDYTKFIYPLKLHEYLASGHPVVGSPIHSLQEFAHVISLAHTADEWSAALTVALHPSAESAGRRSARQAVAKQHDWDLLVRQIATAMSDDVVP